MRWLAQSVLLGWLVVSLIYLPCAQAAAAQPLTGVSQSLTGYLHTHRLPLVGAQVLQNPDGSREVVLYGFTATDFGKHDAVTKTRRFLKDREIGVTNRIKVRPELLSLNRKPAASPPPAGSADSSGAGSARDYANQQAGDQQQYLAQQQQYMQQGQAPGQGSGFLTAVVPLLGLAIIGLGLASGSFGGNVNPNYGSYPPGYNPYYGSYPPYPPPNYVGPNYNNGGLP